MCKIPNIVYASGDNSFNTSAEYDIIKVPRPYALAIISKYVVAIIHSTFASSVHLPSALLWRF